MIKDEILKSIAERSGIDVSDTEKFDTFKTALTSEDEVEVSMPEKWHTFSDEAITSRDKSKYEEGKTAGLEMTIKQFKTDKNLDFEGKTLDKLVEHVAAKAAADAGAEPEARYKELEGKYKAKVAEVEGLQSDLDKTKSEMSLIGVKSSFTTELSSKGVDTTIPADKIVTLFLSEHEITDEGVKKNGSADVIKDEKTLQPISRTDVFMDYANQFATKTPGGPGGGGGGDKGKDSVFTSKSQYDAWVEKAKPEKAIADTVLINSVKANADFYDN